MKKISCFLSLCILFFGCKKSSDTPQPTPNPCNGVNITVNASANPVTTCSSPNGSINANASGGSGPYEYKLDNGTFQTSSNFTGVSVGSHTITAKDANGCTGTATVTVGSNTPTITVNAIATNATSCSSANGSINATATSSSGSTVSNYRINGGSPQSTGVFSNLTPGSFTITATDAGGCIGTKSVTVSSSSPLSPVTSNVSPVVPCSTTVNNGSVTLSASGGISPYSYSFNGGSFSTNATLSGQAAGNVTVQAKDVNGCASAPQTVTIGTASAGPLFTAVKNIINSKCSGCHTGGGSSGGVSFATDCGIVNRATRIKARAVDNSPSVMPPSGAISNAEKLAITNWINAGGQFNQ